MLWRAKKTEAVSFPALLAEAGTLCVLADKDGVATQGRKEMESFGLSQQLAATADIARFVGALGLPTEEMKRFREGFAASRLFTTHVPLKAGLFLLVVKPLKDGQWLLLMEPSTPLPPAVRVTRVKESHADAVAIGWPQLVEQAPIPTLLLDAKGAILKGNPLALRLLPAQMQERFMDHLTESSREQAAALFLKAMESGSAESIEVKLSGAEEKTLALFVSRVAFGAIPAFLLMMIDLTEQKNLELRFAHSQKMQAVGQLAGGIAHDFNNLLTAMIGFSDLLLMRHPAGDQSFADIMQIKQNANRAANLVRQLLAFSRKQTLRAEVVQITDALADLASLIRRLIGENIALTLEHGPELWPVLVDQGQLEQVIINLCVNARDAMQGSGALKVRTENCLIAPKQKPASDYVFPAEDDELTEGEYVRIDVTDSGSGIAPELQRKIFEPFFSTKGVGEGTGLGLSTVYGIIKQTGGYLCVKSEVGKGTTFSLFFRRHSPSAEELAESDAQSAVAPVNLEPANAPLDLTGAGTILLVEDEAPVRIFSARALRNKGYTVFEADCADAAYQVIAEHKGQLDLIITDVVMPGQTGPQMVETLSQQYPDLKVIFISGYAEDAFVKTYGSERSFNFLPKPFSLKQLAAKVKEVLEQAS